MDRTARSPWTTPFPPNGLQVLVVEDHADTRRLLEWLLTFYGIDVACAESGEAALRLAPQCRPDLVIIDIVMPGMNGLDTARQLRVQPSLSAAPVVALTGLANVQSMMAMLDAGFNEILLKPCEPERVVHTVFRLLKRTPPPPSHS